MTFLSCYHHTKDRLKGVADNPDGEAQQMIMDAFSINKSQFILSLQDSITDERGLNTLGTWIAKRLSGMPLQYVLGRAYFRDLRLSVSPGVLIPRPETELLVDAAERFLEQVGVVLECGVGSGAISISIAKLAPHLPVLAWDISAQACKVALRNAEAHHLSNITIFEGDFFQGGHIWEDYFRLGKKVLLLSNPPYIPTIDIDGLDAHVKDFEPHGALDGGSDGLSYYARYFKLFSQYASQLISIFEIGIHQEESIKSLASASGFHHKMTIPDLAGHPRIMIF